jgi:hypothetical protein
MNEFMEYVIGFLVAVCIAVIIFATYTGYIQP